MIDTGHGKRVGRASTSTHARTPRGSGAWPRKRRRLRERLPERVARAARLRAGGARGAPARARLRLDRLLRPHRPVAGSSGLGAARTDRHRPGARPWRRGRPKLLPAAACDYLTGGLAAYGALAALARRTRQGGAGTSACAAADGKWIRAPAIRRGQRDRTGRRVRPDEIAAWSPTTETPSARPRPGARALETPPRWDRPSVPPVPIRRAGPTSCAPALETARIAPSARRGERGPEAFACSSQSSRSR